MMNLPNNDDLHLLAGAYVVNAVDELDRRRFEQHLASCESCQDDVASLRRAVDGLAMAAAEPAPSGLKANVLAEIDGVRQSSPLMLRSTRRPRLPRLAAVAAIVVALGLGGALWQQRSGSSGQAAAIVRAPDMRSVRLSGSSVAANFTYAPSVGVGVLVTEGLPRASSGRTYQLWIVEAGAPRSVGTFGSGADGATLKLPRPPANGAVIAVTLEPTGGSAQPTTTPVLASEPL
jgi:anti-sigma-K factor RskA